MGLGKTNFLFKVLVISAVLVLFSAQFSEAMRSLHGDGYQLFKKYIPDWESSLARGTETPSGGSPCTYIPGGSGHCTLNGKNFAGRRLRSPPPSFPSAHNAAINNDAAAFMEK
ncbi:hypothetical protein SLE2022_250390 [Rubroshorea leprosula]